MTSRKEDIMTKMFIFDEKEEGRSQETTTTRQVQHEEQEDDPKEDDWKESSSLASCSPSIPSSPFISFPSSRSHHQTPYEDPCHDLCFPSDSHHHQQPALHSSCIKSFSRRRQSSRQPSSSIPVIFTLFIVILSFVILELLPNLFSKSANIFLFTSASSSSQAERRLSSRIVTTKYGALRGFLVSLPNRGLEPVEVFMGIPYASPPVGKLRFMPPVTPAHWTGVRPAHSPGSVCPQKLPNISNETAALQSMTQGRVNVLKRLLPSLSNQSEDCLYLNIFAPASVGKESIRLPVVMFIHGESFEWNSGSSYDGSVLSSYTNLVVVTVNYRLGVLGFFPALDGNSRGNFGLMDQVAALHWINENIHYFGGDASNVSILGHGHGAVCVNLLMLSPMARGLFHRAIMASGSALSPWAMASDAVEYSRKLASKVGCPDDPDKHAIMVDCLRTKSISEIVSADVSTPRFLSSLGPTIDGIVIPNDPSSLMESAASSSSGFNSFFGNYDLLLGVPRVGYYDFTMLDERHGIESFRRDKILRTLVRNLFTYHLQEIHLTISNEYTDWTRSPSMTRATDIFESLVETLSDATLVAPAVKTALLHDRSKRSKSSSASTYFYEFSHATERGDYPSPLGCVAGDDLPYIFGAPLVPGMNLGYFSSSYTKQETSFSEMVMTYLGNFVRTGNPNIDSNPSLLDLNGPPAVLHSSSKSSPSSSSSLQSSSLSSSSSTKTSSSSSSGSSSNIIGTTTAEVRMERVPWPAFDEKQQQYMSLSLKPKTRDHYHSHRLSYWNNLIPKLHVPGSLFSPTTPSGIEHHLLTDHHDRDSYEGVTREETSSRLRALLDSPLNSESSFFQGSSSSSSNAMKNMTTKDTSSIKSSTKSPSLSTTSVKLSSSSSSDHLTKSLSASNVDSSQSHHNHQQQDASSSSSSSSSFPSPPKSILNASSLIIQENSLAVLLLSLGTFLLVINAGLFFRSHYNKNGRNRTSNNPNVSGNNNMSHGNMTSGILQSQEQSHQQTLSLSRKHHRHNKNNHKQHNSHQHSMLNSMHSLQTDHSMSSKGCLDGRVGGDDMNKSLGMLTVMAGGVEGVDHHDDGLPPGDSHLLIPAVDSFVDNDVDLHHSLHHHQHVHNDGLATTMTSASLTNNTTNSTSGGGSGSSFKINRSHLYPGDLSLSVPVDGTFTPSPSHHHNRHAGLSHVSNRSYSTGVDTFLVPGSHVSMVTSTGESNSYSYSSPGSNATTTSIATLPRNLYGTIIHEGSNENTVNGNNSNSLDAKLLTPFQTHHLLCHDQHSNYSVYDCSHLNPPSSAQSNDQESSGHHSHHQRNHSSDINI